MDEQDIISLIDRLYESALDISFWSIALEEMAVAFGGIGTSVLSMNGNPPLLNVSPSLQQTAAKYMDGWWKEDCILSNAKERGYGPGIDISSEFLSRDFRIRNTFFQDFLRPQGLSGALCLVTMPFEGNVISINVQRRLDAEYVEPAERRRFEIVARHLSRAAALFLRLSTAEAVGKGLASRLGEFDCAVAVVGHDGRLLLSNAAFDSLRPQGIHVRRGQVALERTDTQSALQKLIWSALNGMLGKSGPDTQAIPRPHSLLPLLIRAVPITPEQGERHIGPIPARAVMLMVLDPSHRAYPNLTTALQALGLTPAQARIALAIGSGKSPRAAAEALHISEATVRTTIKHLYSRLGIDRQSQLARLVSRAVPFSS